MIPDTGLYLSLLVEIARAVHNNNNTLASELKEKLTTHHATIIANKLMTRTNSTDVDVKVIYAISGH